MTSDSWISLGRLLLVTAGVLAVVSAGLVFASIDNTTIIRLPQDPNAVPPPMITNFSRFMAGLVVAVLAGATFISGLASFSWAAAVRRHDLLEEILRKLPD
ncbi:hypothetical protein AB0L06_41475 [Spirillospora sp. NPDC052269]